MVNHVGEKNAPTSQPPTTVPAIVAGWVSVMRDRELGTAIGQIWHPNLFACLLHDVVDAAKRNAAGGIRHPGLLGRFCMVLATPM